MLKNTRFKSKYQVDSITAGNAISVLIFLIRE